MRLGSTPECRNWLCDLIRTGNCRVHLALPISGQGFAVAGRSKVPMLLGPEGGGGALGSFLVPAWASALLGM